MYDGNKITGERCRELSLQLINEKGCNLLELASLENDIKWWENIINTNKIEYYDTDYNQRNEIQKIKDEIKAEAIRRETEKAKQKKNRLNTIKWVIAAICLLAVILPVKYFTDMDKKFIILMRGMFDFAMALLLSRYIYSKNKVSWLCVVLSVVFFIINLPITATSLGISIGVKGIVFFAISTACMIAIYALNILISVSCRINAPSEIADSTVTGDPQYAARLASAQKKDAQESQEEYEHRKEQLEKDKLIAPTELERLRKIENSELYYVFIRYEAEIAKLDCFDCFTPSTSTKEKIRCIFQCFPTNCGNQRAFDLIWRARESYYVKRQECKVLEKQCADMLHDILHG